MGQMISLTAKAKKGYGRDHVKWQPVCGITFQSRQHAVLHDKKAAKSLWGLGLTVTEKDFGKDGRIEDIQMVEKVRADLHHVGPSTDLGRDFGDPDQKLHFLRRATRNGGSLVLGGIEADLRSSA